jgi:hypothetical protein
MLSSNYLHERSSLRIDKRAQIAEKWASRRKQEQSSRPVPKLESPTLCSVLRRSWGDVIKSFALPRQSPRKSSNNSIVRKRESFPSVLNILQERALKDQMELFNLKLLPADYNFHKAIQDMSQSRSRVFLLLDLAAIVQTHVSMRKRLSKGVRMVYSTKHNANPKLLKVLGHLGVGLKVATKYDHEVCQQNCTGTKLWDDSSCVAKPDSFYRRLILDSTPSVASTTPLVVDSPGEVKRLSLALKRMSQRRNKKLPNIQFVLKLEKSDTWREVIEETSHIVQENSHQLVGFSLDLPENFVGLVEFLSFLSELLLYCRNKFNMSSPEVHLMNPNASIDSMIFDWLAEHSNLFSSTTLDVSHLLVANAGATCARIIGVKQNEAEKIHYYIDDGCYGSLSDHSKNSIPLPLKSKATTPSLEYDESEELTATVWGPTCDGLDKVCVGKLPRLSRDDWLVFKNTGFCNVGTTFNGFAPPDVVYCVLGSFLYPPSNGKRRESPPLSPTW